MSSYARGRSGERFLLVSSVWSFGGRTVGRVYLHHISSQSFRGQVLAGSVQPAY
jgi:hypothetical protein